jgi:DNA-binding NtrC family response regulator
MSRARILVCDDEAGARRGVVRALGSGAYDFVECADGHTCLAALADGAVDLVLLDLRMPGLDGNATLARIVDLAAPPPVVVLTADDSVDTALAAVRAGAADFITKPYDIATLRFVVERTLERAASEHERRRLEDELARATRHEDRPRLRGRSPAMVALADAVARVAPSAAAVLVTGETGTGKGLVARAIHEHSRVAAGPFVTVNCAAIPDSLVESELFGYRRGAFTGAERDSAGRIRAAAGGTLFLDEIGDLPQAAQAKLLRVLQDGVVEPLGGGNEVAVELRVVAATHRDLAADVVAGAFREDLFHRVAVGLIFLPPLREREGDLSLLIDHLMAEIDAEASRTQPGWEPKRISAGARALLERQRWPGNVRELKNVLLRASVWAVSPTIREEEIEMSLLPGTPETGDAILGRPLGGGFDVNVLLDEVKRAYVERALAEAGGKKKAAALLGLGSYQLLSQWMDRLGIDRGS